MIIHRKTRELTGKHVLFCLLGFFGVVFAVNAVTSRPARLRRNGRVSDQSEFAQRV